MSDNQEGAQTEPVATAAVAVRRCPNCGEQNSYHGIDGHEGLRSVCGHCGHEWSHAPDGGPTKKLTLADIRGWLGNELDPSDPYRQAMSALADEVEQLRGAKEQLLGTAQQRTRERDAAIATLDRVEEALEPRERLDAVKKLCDEVPRGRLPELVDRCLTHLRCAQAPLRVERADREPGAHRREVAAALRDLSDAEDRLVRAPHGGDGWSLRLAEVSSLCVHAREWTTMACILEGRSIRANLDAVVELLRLYGSADQVTLSDNIDRRES